MLGYVLPFLTFVLLTESERQENVCHVIPVRHFRPQRLYGRWYGVKIQFPSSCTRPPVSDASWFIKPTNYGISITINGRLPIFPYNCISDHVMLRQIDRKRPGYYQWMSHDYAEAVIASTDYKNYLVIHLCIRRSSFEPCERIAMVLSRRVFRADPIFTAKLDTFISKRICLDPKQFIFVNYSPFGIDSYHCTQILSESHNLSWPSNLLITVQSFYSLFGYAFYYQLDSQPDVHFLDKWKRTM